MIQMYVCYTLLPPKQEANFYLQSNFQLIQSIEGELSLSLSVSQCYTSDSLSLL